MKLRECKEDITPRELALKKFFRSKLALAVDEWGWS
jgi:hypothetical protein